VGTLSKQKIKLVSNFNPASSTKVSVEQVHKPCVGENASVSFLDMEMAALVEKLLAPALKATGAIGGAVRVLSSAGKTMRLLGSFGLPSIVVQSESVVESSCGACGQAVMGKGLSTCAMNVCMQRCGAGYFGGDCAHVVATPLLCADKTAAPVGALTLYFATAADAPADGGRSIGAYAELVSAALESALAHAENRRLTLLAERQSIANEIHDALAQTLYYAKMRSSLLLEAMRTENELLAYKCARDIDEALDSGQKTVRELVTHFRCQMDPQGLQFALQKLVDEFCARTDITLQYVNRVADMNLPLEHELQTFLIVREALVNVSTHSGASAAHLTVERNAGHYTFTVADNGAGLGDVTADGHYGLAIMRERAERIGGEVQLESSEGLGTRVRLNFAVPHGPDGV
jgi:two-component system, NarL family, nitrate/nitrite sensor histidine kinase NarX